MNTRDVLDTTLGPTQSVMAIINETGDTKIIWDRNSSVESDNAKAQFDAFKAKGYMAYKVTGKDGLKGDILHKFDPDAERVIFSPPLKGGC